MYISFSLLLFVFLFEMLRRRPSPEERIVQAQTEIARREEWARSSARRRQQRLEEAAEEAAEVDAIIVREWGKPVAWLTAERLAGYRAQARALLRERKRAGVSPGRPHRPTPWPQAS